MFKVLKDSEYIAHAYVPETGTTLCGAKGQFISVRMRGVPVCSACQNKIKEEKGADTLWVAK